MTTAGLPAPGLLSSAFPPSPLQAGQWLGGCDYQASGPATRYGGASAAVFHRLPFSVPPNLPSKRQVGVTDAMIDNECNCNRPRCNCVTSLECVEDVGPDAIAAQTARIRTPSSRRPH